MRLLLMYSVIICVQVCNWFTHLQPEWQTTFHIDNSIFYSAFNQLRPVYVYPCLVFAYVYCTCQHCLCICVRAFAKPLSFWGSLFSLTVYWFPFLMTCPVFCFTSMMLVFLPCERPPSSVVAVHGSCLELCTLGHLRTGVVTMSR